ncbi:MAG: hypothetical protein UR60_C0045G0007 [Candidatus Moranbacteria bacterium GW2011_GWF2_34_56]|nr:MAG: hypothetical protein UR60_C0045G0007 [Candidatus Moranbacteria bacterium GW2011_GWF2_34_56]
MMEKTFIYFVKIFLVRNLDSSIEGKHDFNERAFLLIRKPPPLDSVRFYW